MFGFSPIVKLLLISISKGIPDLPFFMLMTTTPFPALTPQIEAADASLKRVISSMSFGLIELISPSYANPSNIISGLLLAYTVLCPLILMVGSSILLRLKTKLPTAPSNLSNRFVDTRRFNSSLSTFTKDPVTRSLGIVWYPVFIVTSIALNFRYTNRSITFISDLLATDSWGQ